MDSRISKHLLDWYDQNARRLPWRGLSDSYAVWVSEIMLQQTRVDTVIPYFERWMQRFPTLAALAEADQQEVLKYWEGLGYYSRARSLHRAAQEVAATYGGELPRERSLLEKLPGIGQYTAGAIASIAFGQKEAALDGNIRRVYARIFNVTLPAKSPQGERRLWELAAEYLPDERAGDYIQALMDLGAGICLPRTPDCAHCPVADLCQARVLGVQEERPVMEPKPEIPHWTVTAAVLAHPSGDGRVLVAQRPAKGLLGGMWEFPGGKQEDGEDLPACLRREMREELGIEVSVGNLLGVYRHAYTHFRVTLHAFECRLITGEPRPLEASDLRWLLPEEMKAYPMGKIDRQIAARLLAG
ncbi:MAG: A/G-specific adenine glycosylase [Anaerolineaceae bacterium]